MARVWLADYECRPRREADELPDVCVVCGDEATDTIRRTFRWNPGWVWVFLVLGLLPVLIAVLVTRKTMVTDCPVCDRHRGHWWKGNLLATAFALAGIAAAVGGVVLAATVEQPGQPNNLAPVFGLGGLFLLLALLVAGAVVSNRLVRPVEITADDIHLTNVSQEFVDAVKAKRRADRERREQKRRDE